MPQEDTTSYEYQPEEPISLQQLNDLITNIVSIEEDIGKEHIDCSNGACPVDYKKSK
jgi:hypothetical protein